MYHGAGGVARLAEDEVERGAIGIAEVGGEALGGPVERPTILTVLRSPLCACTPVPVGKPIILRSSAERRRWGVRYPAERRCPAAIC